MNIEFQTIWELFCGPGGGGLGASMSKLALGDKDHTHETFMGGNQSWGVKLQN